MRYFYARSGFNCSRRGLSRRNVLSLAGATAAAFSCPSVIVRQSRAETFRMDGNPFSLGVAAGDTSPDGFVLWTRLAPNPLSQDPNAPGGLTSGDLSVDYEIATDSGLRNVVRRGQATAESNTPIRFTLRSRDCVQDGRIGIGFCWGEREAGLDERLP